MHIRKFVVFFYFFVFLVPTYGIDMTAINIGTGTSRNLNDLILLCVLPFSYALRMSESLNKALWRWIISSEVITRWTIVSSVDDSSMLCHKIMWTIKLLAFPFCPSQIQGYSYYYSKSAQVFFSWWKTPNHNIRSKWDSTFFTWSPLWMLRWRSLSTWRLRVRERKSGQNNKLQATE
jgi:hypothetical protein